MKRAVCSWGFLAGLALSFGILMKSGFSSEAYQISVPALACLPYTTAWLSEHQSGFVKSYLMRTNVSSYILGKFFSCGISGGLVEAIPAFACRLLGAEDGGKINLWLVFLSGMLWASVASLLAAVAKSRYLAYGGSFVIYYLLVILHERYFPGLYCLYPCEWFDPSHTWVLGWQGIVAMLVGFLLLLMFLYDWVIRRCMEFE